MKAKHFWIVIGVIGFGFVFLFSKTLSLFEMSDNLHECAFVGFTIISLFGFNQAWSKMKKPLENACGTAAGILILVPLCRGTFSTMVAAVPTAIVAAVLMLLLDKFVVKKYCSD